MPRANSFAPDLASGRPLYRQLVDWLRSDIARRAVGDRIDSEPQLAERFGVSRFTVTRAIEILVDEGLIRRRQGLGSFVAPPPLQRAPSYLSSFTEAVEAQGRKPSHRLLHFGPVAWRRGLPYPEGVALVGLDRLRLVDGEPTAIHRSVIDAGLADRIGLTRSTARAPRFSLYRLLDQAGLKIERGVETLRARLATAEEARLLEIGDEPVVMAVRRETRGPDGALLDVVDAVYDARRYSYQAEIRRDAPATLASSHPRKAMEKDHASNSNIERLSALALGLGAIVTASAAEKPVALIIAQGGLGDQSYNDLAYSGFKKALADNKLEGKAVEFEGRRRAGRRHSAPRLRRRLRPRRRSRIFARRRASGGRQGLRRDRLCHSQSGEAGRQCRLGAVPGAGGLLSRRRARDAGGEGSQRSRA